MAEHTPSNRLAADQPTRGADRNQALADQTDPTTEEMLLPQLDDGITLLDVEGGRGVPILQSLVLDHLLLHDGPAFWVDANGHATTATLAQISPSQRLLDRIHVARGFTAYQHYGAVCDLPTAVNKSIRTSTADSGAADRGQPSRDDDTSPHTPRSSSRQPSTPNTVPTIHSERLTRKPSTRERSPGWRPTPMGTTSRYSLRETNETNSPNRSRRSPTTTWSASRPEWAHGSSARTSRRSSIPSTTARTTRRRSRTGSSCSRHAPQVGVEPTTPAPSTPTPEGVGTGVTADGETVAATADPLLDAWTATGTGGR